MADPLSQAASIITIVQLISKVITFIKGVKGGRATRKRIRGELESCDAILKELQNNAEDLEEGDEWLDTVKELNQPNGVFDRLKITLELITERLEPKTELAKALSFLTWPFSENEVEGLMAAIGREMALLNTAKTNDCQRLSRENIRTMKASTAHLSELITSSRIELVQSSSEILKAIEGLKQSVRHNLTRPWEENAKQLGCLTSKMTLVWDFMVEQSAQKSPELVESLGTIHEDSFQYRASQILDLLGLVESTLIQDQKKSLIHYTTLNHAIDTMVSQNSSSSEKISTHLVEIKTQLAHDRQQKMTKEEEKMRLDILNWLSGSDYADQQSDLVGRCQTGAGQWVLGSKEFLEWMSAGNALFCPGIPGSGKTFLTSIVAEHLRKRFPAKEGYAVAFIYCDFKNFEQDCTRLVASLLKQIARSLPRLPRSLQALYDRHATPNTRPSVEEYTTTILKIAPCFQKIFLLVDALDELNDLSGNRGKFLSEVSTLQSQCNHLHLFATSRFDLAIDTFFQDNIKLRITAADKDIESYITSSLTLLAKCVAEDAALQDDIVVAITNAARGMFLLARLLLESLKGKRTVNAVREAIRSLPSGTDAYHNAYDGSMNRIKNQSIDDTKLAIHILKWLSCAKRHLTLTELQNALAVKPGSTNIDKCDIYSLEDLLSVCAGLVEYDASSGVLRLAHHTTQEYFTQKRELWFPTAESDLANICLTYLMFNEFGNGACWDIYAKSDPFLMERLQNNPFYHYASVYWGHHVRESSQRFAQSTLFLGSKNHVASSNEARLFGLPYHQKAKAIRWTAFQLAAFFGLQELEQLSDDLIGLYVRDAEGRSLLSLSAAEGHYDLVKVLLERLDVDSETEDVDGRTALSYAAENGHHQVIDMLLDNELVNADSVDKFGRTPLSYASGNGHIRVVHSLLASERVDPNNLDEYKRSALSFSALNGRKEMVATLLEQPNVNPNIKDSIGGQTPLSLAAEMGHNDIIKLLMKSNKVRVNTRTSTRQTPLMLATLGGFTATVKLLLSYPQTKLNIADENGNTPLLVATCNESEDIVRSLLAHHSINVNCRDEDGTTPLFVAASRGNEKILNMLLAHSSIETDCVDNKGDTPLLAVAWNGDGLIMTTLLKHSTTALNIRNRRKESPLSRAIANGHEHIVKLLLAKENLKPNRRDAWGSTPLIRAVQEGKDKIVELLLQHKNIRPNCRDIHKNTALTIATISARIESVRLLLAHQKTHVNCRDWHGQTPYMEAEGREYAEIMELLIDRRGIDPYLGIKIGRTDDPGHSLNLDHLKILDEEWFFSEGEDFDGDDKFRADADISSDQSSISTELDARIGEMKLLEE